MKKMEFWKTWDKRALTLNLLLGRQKLVLEMFKL